MLHPHWMLTQFCHQYCGHLCCRGCMGLISCIQLQSWNIFWTENISWRSSFPWFHMWWITHWKEYFYFYWSQTIWELFSISSLARHNNHLLISSSMLHYCYLHPYQGCWRRFGKLFPFYHLSSFFYHHDTKIFNSSMIYYLSYACFSIIMLLCFLSTNNWHFMQLEVGMRPP